MANVNNGHSIAITIIKAVIIVLFLSIDVINCVATVTVRV